MTDIRPKYHYKGIRRNLYESKMKDAFEICKKAFTE